MRQCNGNAFLKQWQTGSSTVVVGVELAILKSESRNVFLVPCILIFFSLFFIYAFVIFIYLSSQCWRECRPAGSHCQGWATRSQTQNRRWRTAAGKGPSWLERRRKPSWSHQFHCNFNLKRCSELTAYCNSVGCASSGTDQAGWPAAEGISRQESRPSILGCRWDHYTIKSFCCLSIGAITTAWGAHIARCCGIISYIGIKKSLWIMQPVMWWLDYNYLTPWSQWH